MSLSGTRTTFTAAAEKPEADSEVGLSFFRASVPAEDAPLVIGMVRLDGLFASSGLKPGMVVESVMGIPSSTFSTADEATDALRSAEAGEIVIEAVRMMGEEDDTMDEEETTGLESSTSSTSTTANNLHVEKDRQLLQAYTCTIRDTSSSTKAYYMQAHKDRDMQAQKDREQYQRERQAQRDRVYQRERQTQKHRKQAQKYRDQRKMIDEGCWGCCLVCFCCSIKD